MFIRFVTGQIHKDSHVSAGLFWAARDLLWSDELPGYEYEALVQLRAWFNAYLDSPFEYLANNKRYDRAVCWFRATASEYLERAWEIVTILERNDVYVWTIRSEKTGYVYYEDHAQVFAEPFHDVRQILWR